MTDQKVWTQSWRQVPMRASPYPPSGEEQRENLRKVVQRDTVCNLDAIDRIGAYDIRDVYYYFTERLGADKKLIDRELTRTRYVDDFIVPRRDMADAAKRDLILKLRDQHLCRILNKLHRRYTLSGEDGDIDDFFERHVSEALQDHIEWMTQKELTEPPPAPVQLKNPKGRRVNKRAIRLRQMGLRH